MAPLIPASSIHWERNSSRALDRVERLGNELLQVEHLDTRGAQGVGKGIVLALRLGQEGHVVKEQARKVARRQVGKLVARAVQHDLLELSDLVSYVEPARH